MQAFVCCSPFACGWISRQKKTLSDDKMNNMTFQTIRDGGLFCIGCFKMTFNYLSLHRSCMNSLSLAFTILTDGVAEEASPQDGWLARN